MKQALKIGFIGLGNMGAPMVRCLARHGHSLVLYDRRPAAVEALLDCGDAVVGARDVAEVGRACEVVITMLPDAQAVAAVVLASEGEPALAEVMQAGGVVIDMSSSAPSATLALGEALAAKALHLVDAPVSGGVPRARDGTLTIMAGGATEIIDRVESVLASMGKVQRTGPLASGHAMKALNYYVSAAGLLAVCEALIIAERFGLDPQVANEVLKSSTGRNNTTDRKVEPFILSGRFDSGFALELLRKDLGIALGLAEGIDLAPPWLSACRKLLEEADLDLGPGADHTAVFRYLQQRLLLVAQG